MKKSTMLFAVLCGIASLAQASLVQAAQPAGTEQRPSGGSFTPPPPGTKSIRPNAAELRSS